MKKAKRDEDKLPNDSFFSYWQIYVVCFLFFWCSQSVHIIHTNPVGFSLVKKKTEMMLNENDCCCWCQDFFKEKENILQNLELNDDHTERGHFFPVIIRFHSYLPTLFFCSFGVAIIKLEWSIDSGFVEGFIHVPFKHPL